jgi:dihydroneopterin aldolase
MSISTVHSNLVLPGIRCLAHVGWSEAERSVAQAVVIDVAIAFRGQPVAPSSDQLDDTVDYAAIARRVVRICAADHYALLERMGQALYDGLRQELPDRTGLFIEVAKLRAPLVELEHGARFAIGDWEGGSAATSARRTSTRSETFLLLRSATHADLAALQRLVEMSVWGILSNVYSQQQLATVLETAFGVDSLLVDDGTYFVIEHEAKLVAAGGWSRREKRFGADLLSSGGGARRLDPACEAARIRAFFVHPAWTRRGLASALLTCCEASAAAEGFRTTELTATLSGEPFYRSQGYESLGQVSYAASPGTTLQFVSMRKGALKS